MSALLSFLFAASAFAGWSEQSFDHSAGARIYSIFLPSAKPAGLLPAILLLHGGGGDAKGMRYLADIDAFAEKEGFAVVAPNGNRQLWNDGRPEMSTKSDDEKFLLDFKKEIVKRYGIDPNRILLAGMSNGGMMALTMLCRHSRDFFAYAAVAGSIGEQTSKKCTTRTPARLLMIAGDKDPLVPYSGGQVVGPFRLTKRGRVAGIEKTVSFFRERFGCSEEAARSVLEADSADPTSVVTTDWKCGGSRIKLIVLKGGGHAWPGGKQYLPERLIGKTSNRVSATLELVRFFKELE